MLLYSVEGDEDYYFSIVLLCYPLYPLKFLLIALGFSSMWGLWFVGDKYDKYSSLLMINMVSLYTKDK